MFWYFSDLDQKQPLCLPVPDVLRILESRNRDHVYEPPIYEYLKEPQSRVYFDLDGPPQVPEFPFILLQVVKNVFQIDEYDIGGILSASSSSYSSYHVFLNFRATRTVLRCAAMKLQVFLNTLGFSSMTVDPKVYGVTQKFRAIFSTKRNQNRPFLPEFNLYGGREFFIEDTLITIIPKRPLYFTNMTLPTNLAWFRRCLDTPALEDRLKHMATSYKEVDTVGRSLYVDGLQNNKIELAEDLYVEFRQLAINPEPEEQLRAGFQKNWINIEKSQFNLIKKWIKETGIILNKEPKNAKSNKEKTTEKTPVPLYEPIPSITDTCEPPSKPFDYITYQQYLIGEIITRSEKIRCYLKQFTRMNGPLRLWCLVHDKEFITYQENLVIYNSFYNKPSVNDLPFPNLPLRNTTYCFYQWLMETFEIEVPQPEYIYDCTIHSHVTRSFLEIAFDLDPECAQEIYKQGSLRSVHYGPDEERDWKKEIEQLFKFLKDPLFYMQIAYRQVWQELATCSHSSETFWILFAHIQSKCFKADKIFHYLNYVTQPRTAALFLFSVYPFITQIPGSAILYFFDFRSGVWTVSEQARHTLIAEFSACFSYVSLKGSHCVTASTAGVTYIESALASLSVIQQNAAAPDVTKSRGYLLFNNGIYDGFKQEFTFNSILTFGGTDFVIHNPKYIFMGKIYNDFRPLNDQDLEAFNDMESVFYTGMHGDEVGTYWRRVLGLLLFGMPFKGFVEHVGDSNCGKSTEIEMMTASFGSYVVPGFTANYENRKMDSRPEERQLSFIVNTWFGRISPASEKGSTGNKMQAERVKKITSAATDRLMASLLFQNADSAGYVVNFVPLFYVNHPLVFDNEQDPGIPNRRCTITWGKVYETVITDPTMHLLRRPEVSKWPKDPYRQLLYIHLAIQGFHEAVALNWHNMNPKDYKPASIQVIDENAAPSSEDLMERFMYYYQITGDPSHRVLRQDLVRTVEQDMKLIFDKTLKIFKEYVGAYGVKIDTARPKISGVKHTAYTGILARASLIEPTPILADLPLWKKLMRKHNGVLNQDVILNLEYVRSLCLSNQYFAPDMHKVLEYGTEQQIEYLNLAPPTVAGQKRSLEEV